MNKDIIVILAIQVALHVMDQIKMIAQVALIQLQYYSEDNVYLNAQMDTS